MSPISTTAMVLAAGLGTRMRPLTLTTPKPLLEVGGRTMLDHSLDKLRDVGVRRVVVNTFYLAEKIEAHLSERTDLEIVISRETELLDTGGGIKNALRWLGDEPFFALNADLPWLDGEIPALRRMANAWNPDIMDAELLLMPTDKARGFKLDGDFMLDADGRVWREAAPRPRSHVLISAQILKPQAFDNVREKRFSNNAIWNAAETSRRLYGIEHDGACYHVGTPDDLTNANRLLASGAGWGVDS